MNIFFSYPHDANASLVMRIKADLEARGHEIWLDSSEIKEGDEWRNKITRGILGSQAVVAFLSKHSVRDPGVCLNEIGIALAEKSDDALVTVLVEPEKDVSAPISITHIQWLSMEDWQEFANDGGWYKTQLNKLIEIIENPSSVSRNLELETLREVLDPLSFNADIAQHLRDFTGRRWLFERYTNWLSGDATSRVFRLEGGPGLGKTAFASQLAHATKSSVLAIFLCQSSRNESRSPLRLIQTLAYQLATRLPDYRARLLKVPAITNPELMKDKNEADLWANLISEPLSGVGKGLIDRQRMAIVIDGLDEASENGYNAIVKLLAENIRNLPSWIGFVLTGRADPEVVQRLSAFKPDVINGEDPQNLDDINEYIDGWMQTETKAGHLTQEQVISAKAALINKSEGTFLYLIKAREALADGTLSLTRPGELPQGLNEIYLRFFERRFADAANENSIWVRYVKPLLAYILVSPEPLPLDLARTLMGWDVAEDGDEQESKALVSLGSLVNQRPAEYGVTLNLFHKSVREWLQHAELAGLYFVGTRNALISLTTEVWQRYRVLQKQYHYGWLVLPDLLPMLNQKAPQMLERLLGPLDSETCRVLFKLASSLPPKLRFDEALAMFQILVDYFQLLCDATPQYDKYACVLGDSFTHLGILQKELGNTQAALDSQQRALDIRQRLFDASPENAEYVRALGDSFLRFAELQGMLGDAQAEQDCAQRALDIHQRLLGTEPENAKYANALSYSFNFLGDLQQELGNTQAALDYQQRALDIRQRLLEIEPENTEYTNNLSISLGRLGALQKALGNMQAALDYGQRALDISQHLYEAAPENAEYAFDLSLSFEGVGYIQRELGNTQAALDYQQRALDIRQRLLDTAPENARYAFAITYSFDHLGSLQWVLGNTQAALDYGQRALDIRQRLSDTEPENAKYANSLRLSLNTLGRLLVGLGDKQTEIGDNHAALDYQQRALGMRQRLYDAVPENTNAYNMSVSLSRLSDVQKLLGNMQAALDYGQRALDISKHLYEADPENAEYAYNLSFILSRLGKLLAALGDKLSALDYHQRSLDIDQDLLETAPADMTYVHKLLDSLYNLYTLNTDLGHVEIARSYSQRWNVINQRLKKQ